MRILSPAALAFLMVAFCPPVMGQSPDTVALNRVIDLLARRAQQIDRVSFDFTGIRATDEESDTARYVCAFTAAATNELGAHFKIYMPAYGVGAALQGEKLTFFYPADQTYGQTDLEREGYHAIYGSPLASVAERSPLAAAVTYRQLLRPAAVESVSIDSNEVSVRIDVRYTDTEHIQNNHSVFEFTRTTGLFRSSLVTYSDGIDDSRHETSFSNVGFDQDFSDVTAIPYSPEGTDYIPREEPEQRPDLSVGDTLPHFAEILTALHLRNPASALYLVDVWYYACAPCQKLSPLIEQLYQEDLEGVAIFGLNLFDSEETIAKYQQLKGVTFPSYAGEGTRDQYAINSFPMVYLLDKQGKILNVTVGYDADFIEQITPIIDLYLGK